MLGVQGRHGRRQQSRDHEAGHSGRDVAEDEEGVDLLRQQCPDFRSRIVLVEDVERRPDEAEEYPDGHGGDGAQDDPLAGLTGGPHGLVALNGHLIDAHVLGKMEQVHECRHPHGLFGEIQGGAAHRELAVGQRHSHHLAEAARHHPEDDGQADESAQDQGKTLDQVGPDDCLQSSGNGIGGHQDPEDHDHPGQRKPGHGLDGQADRVEDHPQPKHLEKDEGPAGV